MPKVSILMNCYNGQKYLQEAIDSIYAQTFKDWEIIFIDNCSTDNSAKIAKSYDNKLKYYKTKKNTKLGEARNFGLQYCASDYLAFLDVDDCYLPNKLEKQIHQLMDNLDYQMSYTGGFFIDENSKIIKKFTPKANSGLVFKQQLKNYEINMQSVMIRNNSSIVFNDELEFSPDYDLFMKTCSKSMVGVIENPLVKYRRLKNSLTNKTIHRWAIEMQYTLDSIFKKHSDLKQKYPKEIRMAYAKVAYYRARYLISINEKSQATATLSAYKSLNLMYLFLYLMAHFPKPVWDKIHQLFKN